MLKLALRADQDARVAGGLNGDVQKIIKKRPTTALRLASANSPALRGKGIGCAAYTEGYEVIIVEIKALAELTEIEVAHLINYLKATGLKVGLLINFGSKSLEYKRLVYNLSNIVRRLRTPEEYAPLSQVNSTGQGLHGLIK